MKRVVKSKESECKTFDEYKRVYFPNDQDLKKLEKEDPHNFGAKLARKSMEQYKHLLKIN
ncbi:MAG TPA: hypothetical protein VMU88_00630 [bacterium]|nr:hypothetical protein [bacterium]